MAFDATRYWEDRHAAGESLDTVGWQGLGTAFNGRMYAVRRRVFSRVVRACVPLSADLRVLDVGSGTGFYLDLWHELGVKRVEGSDLSEQAVARLQTAHPGDRIRQLDIGAEANGDTPAGQYDVVSAMDVLYHIVDDAAYARAIANLGQLIRPGGHLVMSENMLAGQTQRAESQVSRSEVEIVSLLGSAGLEPVALAPVFVLLNTPVDSSNRWLKRWWWLLSNLVHNSEAAGSVLGAVLIPVELLAVRIARRGPCTKLLICRRLATPGAD